MKSKQLLSWKA